MSGFHAACHHCPRRDDTAGLSARQIKQLAEAVSWTAPPLFQAEGVGAVAINDLSPAVAYRIAREFAGRINRPTASPGDRQATIVVGNDGRLATAAILAAIVEGVRWSGCEAIDIGPASVPCAAMTIGRLAAAGGAYVGNAQGAPHTVALKFWAEGEPLSQGGALDEIAASLRAAPEATIDRPARRCGALRRFNAADIYLGDLRPAYHAMRPLVFILDCKVEPVVAYVKELIRSVACRITAAESAQRLGPQVTGVKAHFGVRIDDDGENCRVVDECGQAVEPERLAALIAGGPAGSVARGKELRQQTFRDLQTSRAALAVDASGRLWYAGSHPPFADALQTLTRLLALLSRDDRPLSAVLGAMG